MPTGVFAGTEDFGNSGLDTRIARAATELSALDGAALLSGRGPSTPPHRRRRVRRPDPFELLLHQVGAA